MYAGYTVHGHCLNNVVLQPNCCCNHAQSTHSRCGTQTCSACQSFKSSTERVAFVIWLVGTTSTSFICRKAARTQAMKAQSSHSTPDATCTSFPDLHCISHHEAQSRRLCLCQKSELPMAPVSTCMLVNVNLCRRVIEEQIIQAHLPLAAAK